MAKIDDPRIQKLMRRGYSVLEAAARIDTEDAGSIGLELFYLEDLSTVTATVGNWSDVPGLQATFTVVDDRPIHFEYGGYLRNATAAGISSLQLLVDGVVVPNSQVASTDSTGNKGSSVSRKKRLTGALSLGQHTAKIQLGSITGGTASYLGGGGAPGFFTGVKA